MTQEIGFGMTETGEFLADKILTNGEIHVPSREFYEDRTGRDKKTNSIQWLGRGVTREADFSTDGLTMKQCHVDRK
jgi:hypothetical protein